MAKLKLKPYDLDKLYLEWCGVEHVYHSCYPVHDSAACQDFARYCIEHGIEEIEKPHLKR